MVFGLVCVPLQRDSLISSYLANLLWYCYMPIVISELSPLGVKVLIFSQTIYMSQIHCGDVNIIAGSQAFFL